MVKKITIVFVFLAPCAVLLGSGYDIQGPNFQPTSINQDTTYIEDAAGKADIEAILNINNQKWKKLPKRGRFDFTNSVIWTKSKISIANPEKTSTYLLYKTVLTDRLNFYLAKNGEIVRDVKSGTKVKAKDKLHVDYRHVFPMGKLQVGEYNVYIKTETNSQARIDLWLMTLDSLNGQLLRDVMLFGAYFGCAFFLCFYNLFLFVNLRKTVYLSYLFFISAMAYNILLRVGLFDFYFGDYELISSSVQMPYTLMLSGLTAAFFTKSFLATKERMPLTDKFMTFLILLAIGLVCLFPFLARSVFIEPIGQAYTFFASCSYMIIGFMALKFGIETSKYYLSSWLFLLSAVFVWLLTGRGFIDSNFFTQNVVLFGQMAEMIILNFGVTVMMRDLEIKKKEAQIEALDRNKLRDMLRVISHDLANPLSAAYNFSQLALNSESASETEECNTKINKSLTNMIGIVKALKDSAQAELAGGKLVLSPFHLAEVFEWLNENFEYRIQEKNLTIEYCEQDFDNVWVFAERSCFLNSVVANIVSNAIKFSDVGGILSISMVLKKNRTIIKIRDYGIGMPNDTLKRIFNPEGRTNRQGTLGEEGNGFGMPLAKKYMQQMGGEVVVKSWMEDTLAEKRGTEISLSLESCSNRKNKLAA